MDFIDDDHIDEELIDEDLIDEDQSPTLTCVGLAVPMQCHPENTDNYRMWLDYSLSNLQLRIDTMCAHNKNTTTVLYELYTFTTLSTMPNVNTNNL